MRIAFGAALAGLVLHGAAAAASLCDTGRRQAPIDIVAPRLASGPALEFDYHPAPLRWVNDGHTVRVRFDGTSRLRLGSRAYRLQQFHFHRPGGDRIAGEEFPLAMHFPHKGPDGGLLSLVLLFRQGAAHPALDALLPELPASGTPERRLAGRSVDPAAFLPASRAYYAYDGSLTGPPCTEGVRWIVLKTPLEASPTQLARLAAAVPPNARAPQPLHGRVVTEVR